MPFEEDLLELFIVQQCDDFSGFNSQGETGEILLATPCLLFIYCSRSMPATKVFQHFSQELSKIVGLFRGAHEDQRDESGRFEEEVVKAEGPKVWRPDAVEVFEESEAEICIKR